MKTAKHAPGVLLALSLLFGGSAVHAQQQSERETTVEVTQGPNNPPGALEPGDPFYVDIEDDVVEDTKLLFYPNPGNGVIQVKNAPLIEQNIIVYNLAGQVESTQAISEVQPVLDLSSLKKGIYLLKSPNGTFKYSKL